MQDDMNDAIASGKKQMDDAIEHLRNELVKIRTGKASPSMLGGIMVDYYGSQTPLSQVANVGTSDARTLTIQPWEKNMIPVIEKAIMEANLGLNPQNDGEMIRINIPPLTEERRKQLVKQSKALGEDSKVSLRSIRHKMMDAVKNAVKEGYPEDAGKVEEEKIEKAIKSYTHKIDEMIEAKEQDILTI